MILKNEINIGTLVVWLAVIRSIEIYIVPMFWVIKAQWLLSAAVL
jgi:hypothetical protein